MATPLRAHICVNVADASGHLSILAKQAELVAHLPSVMWSMQCTAIVSGKLYSKRQATADASNCHL
jgi:hypothetical protein